MKSGTCDRLYQWESFCYHWMRLQVYQYLTFQKSRKKVSFLLDFSRCEHSFAICDIRHLSRQEHSAHCSRLSVNLRPISEHGGRIPRLFLWHSVVVLWSFGWQCNQCCSVRHQSYSFSISLVSLSHTLNSQTWKWT